MKVGFIGVGNMGAPIAGWVLKKGFPLVVHDLRRELATPLLEQGATWADSPGAAAAQCDVVCTMLPGPPEMETVTLGPQGVLEGIQPGAIYIDHTTTSPELVKRVGAAVAERGASMLDAPVAGDRPSILAGILTMFVGGEKAVFERARPVLNASANKVVHVGELAAGSITKIVINALAMGIDLLATEALTLGVKAGVGLPQLLEAIRHANMFSENASINTRMPATLFKGEFTPSRFYLKLAYKDYRLAADLAAQYRVPTRLIKLCEMEMLEAMNRGWGDKERVISSTLQEERAQVELRGS